MVYRPLYTISGNLRTKANRHPYGESFPHNEALARAVRRGPLQVGAGAGGCGRAGRGAAVGGGLGGAPVAGARGVVPGGRRPAGDGAAGAGEGEGRGLTALRAACWARPIKEVQLDKGWWVLYWEQGRGLGMAVVPH